MRSLKYKICSIINRENSDLVQKARADRIVLTLSMGFPGMSCFIASAYSKGSLKVLYMVLGGLRGQTQSSVQRATY